MADQTDILKNHTPLDPDRMFAELEEKLQQQVHPVDRRGRHRGGHGAG